MAQMIFVNLPVKNLKTSIEFYKQLGMTQNEQFSDHTAACMVLNESIYVMLLTHGKFKTFTPNAIGDAFKTTQVLNCLSCESKDAVSATVAKALKAGGKRYAEPQDHGFMVQDSVQDPDGHMWEFVYMDMSAAPQS